MATVGINFGSATSGTGFDVASTVTAILAVTSAIETPWKKQITNLQSQDTALTKIGTDLATLSSAVTPFTNFDGVFSNKLGSSSATNILTLTGAGSSSTAGSHTIEVMKLATTSSIYSDEVTNASDTLSGSVSLQVGSSSAQVIAIDSTNNTLTTLAATINSGSYGITASVVTDTVGSRLLLVSNTSGSAGKISLGGGVKDTTASKTVGFTVGQTAANAELTVDGLVTTSASNTVTGAIPGVTFQLLSADAGTSVQVQVTNDNSSVVTAAQTLVKAYNAVVADLKVQTGKDSTGASQPLYGSPILSQLQSQLSSSLFGGKAVGSVSSIQQLGITVNPDGTLALSNSTLLMALNAHYSDTVGFFQNTDSFGQALTSILNGLGTSSSQSVISLAQTQNTSVEASLNLNVTNEEALIATEKTSLTAQLNTANQELQSIPQQILEINQIYSAITGYNQQK